MEHKCQNKSIDSIIIMVRHFRQIDNEIPAQMIQCLLEVALMPGTTMKNIEQATGLSQSAVSRNIQTLGEWHRNKKPGYQLVETIEDPNDTRRKVVFLTVKGRRIMSDLLTLIAGKPTEYTGPDAKAWASQIRDTWKKTT